MSNKSSSAGEIISLPKGGGALHGLGEKFAPDLHTGTGNFTVPLALPAGRQGFQPQLSLVYSTGNGNGPYGLGWNLTVPALSRKTSEGIPRYRNESAPLKERDTFVLSGAEDLVPVVEADVLTRYRPRTEGLFARIEHRHIREADFWQVHSRDGLVSLYGATQGENGEPAVVADPEDRGKIFCWKLTQTEDLFGNRIRYEYERDSDETSEHHWDQLYLKRISYADYPQAGNDGRPVERFLVSVSYIYEERPDPFSEYRAGFEIRTRKRCARIEIRTHADAEQLARTYHLIYLDQRGIAPERLPANGVSLLSQVLVEGHDEERSERLPPLEFSYTTFEPTRRRYQPFTAVGDSVPERSLGHPEFALVNLFSNGLPDVIQMNGAVRYWRNLGRGQFDLPRAMTSAPASVHLGDPGVQFADANGDGRADLLVLDGLRNGYFPLTSEGSWDTRGFVRYRHVPAVDLDAPDVRLLDLDGDGVTDALRTGINFELYYNDPEVGWAESEVRERVNSDSFPNVSFTDPRVKLGDMTGDGLQDIVLIHNGRIEYWPYLGYGRWGRRVVMRNSPRFEDAAFFPGVGYDPKRLLLGDVDGDGLADLVYVSSGRITVFINQGGNALSDPLVINGTPTFTNADSVRLADMLGNGTDGILWTYDFRERRDSTYKFLDLTGGVKPYLLDRTDNHLGAVTRVEYAPSTRFYLEDQRRPETRWLTTLPFPVQVVALVEVLDEISRGKLTTEYRYHHGYWDGVEREFRGFGLVEQLDTETFADYHAAGLHDAGAVFEPVNERHFSPPTLTRTWFHQGPVREADGDWQELDLSAEYWPDDPPTLGHIRAVNTFLQTLPDWRSKRDALRALRASILRTELFALDGSAHEDRPYTVTEYAYGLREESVPGAGDGDRMRIFFPHLLAQRTTQWERGDEPLTSFSFTDDYDAFGCPRTQVSLAVPRGRDYKLPGPPGDPYLGVKTTTVYCQRDDDRRYFVDRVAATSAFEILNDGSQPVFVLYEAVRTGSVPLNLIGQSFNYYDGEAFVGLPFGEAGDFGAPVRTETLVFTGEILQSALAAPEDPGTPAIPPYLRPAETIEWTDDYPEEFRSLMKPLAGYVFADGSDHRATGYFAQAARVAYDFQVDPAGAGRGLRVATRDPLGADTSVSYDQFQLRPVAVTDALGLSTTASTDYRVMQPREVTDVNGNRTRFSFTPLGLPEQFFVIGKANANEGDAQRAGTRLVYDLLAFDQRRQAISVRTIRQEHHDTETDVPPEERDAAIESMDFSDGFGRLLQTRVQAEDVLFGDADADAPRFGNGVLPADQNDDQGTRAAVTGRRRAAAAGPNVVVSGAQLYDNKGHVVEKFEPFFSTGFDFAPPSEAEHGQKVTMFYDPRGQVLRTVNPDGSEQLVVYGVPENLSNPNVFTPTPWEAYTYDANDNAARTHAEAAAAFSAHVNTPSSIVIDPLGRTVSTVVRNGPDPARDWFTTRSTCDVRGNLLTVTDPLGRVAFRYAYDLANRPLRIESIDAGVRRTVLDARGNEVERRDSKGALILQMPDVLTRLVRLWARDESGSAVTLREVLIYGDGGDANQPVAQRAANRAANRLGELFQHYDEAGLQTFDAYDFKGNLLEKVRQIIADAPILSVFVAAPANRGRVSAFRVEWQPGAGETLDDRALALLDSTEYRTSFRFDALRRAKSMQYPQDVEGRRRVLKPEYNRAGELERVRLDDAVFVERIAYDAKGQRTLIAYGNGVMTRYAFDPLTFRQRRLRSERYAQPQPHTYSPTGAPLQDFAYDYDLAGNIIFIQDRTPESGILSNPQAATAANPALAQLLVSGNALVRQFEYDPIYRLLSATGRECDLPAENPPFADQPRCTDLTRARGYTERYAYDAMGNVLRLEHRNGPGGFTREFIVETTNNRLREMKAGASIFAYTFDANGNMTAETSSRQFEWDHSDQMKTFRTQTEGAEPSVHAHYLYDATGQRVKKLVRKQGGQVEVTHYIDGMFEHHRTGGGAQSIENNHLHVMDDQQRIALMRVGPAHPDDRGPAVQFQLGDHLGSSSVVVDSSGSLVNREEFTPYGETSFGSFAKKRYRFTGKERDEESGLSYYGARYYAPGLTRWTSADPAGIAGGLNLFTYVLNNPLCLTDHFGMQPVNLPEDPDNPGFYVVPGETIELHGTAPEPDQLEWSRQLGLTDYYTRDEFESIQKALVRNDPHGTVPIGGYDWEKPPPDEYVMSEEFWTEYPDEANRLYKERLAEAHGKYTEYWDREYRIYRAGEANRLDKNLRLMEGYGKIGEWIGWGTVAGVGLFAGGVVVAAAKPIPSLATSIANSPTLATVGAASATAKEIIPRVLQEGETFLAVVKGGQILAQTRNTLLSHAEFAKRFLGALPEGSEVVTFGKYEGQIEALLSRTFHGSSLPASAATLDALRKAFR